MKATPIAAIRGLAIVLAVSSLVSCSSSMYDVRRANEHRSVSGITETLGSRDPRMQESRPLVNNVSRESKGPKAYLLLVNLVRAPFIPLVGAMEIAGAASGAYATED